MVIVAALSIVIASYDFRALAAAYASHPTGNAPPQGLPLQLLRGTMEYIQIIGAVVAIALGYLSVARERTGNTMPLIASRPVPTRALFLGRILGATALLGAVMLATAVIAVLSIGLVGGHWLGGTELLQLAIACVASVVYMLLFYALGTWVTARSRVLANGLAVALVIWLTVVLIIPQIGDTMDPDNQVPGGLFNALQVKKPQELQVLAHFKTYETIRNTGEETSITKHFERFTFAFLGIKTNYIGMSLGNLLSAKRGDIAWAALYGGVVAAGMASALRRERAIRPST
jgi:ABC-2 type transport system permease protein